MQITIGIFGFALLGVGAAYLRHLELEHIKQKLDVRPGSAADQELDGALWFPDPFAKVGQLTIPAVPSFNNMQQLIGK